MPGRYKGGNGGGLPQTSDAPRGSPLGTGRIFEVPEIRELAEKYGRSVAQICIRWSLQRGYLPLPKSVTPARIRENLGVFDFSLAEEDMRRINALEGCVGYSDDPDTATW